MIINVSDRHKKAEFNNKGVLNCLLGVLDCLTVLWYSSLTLKTVRNSLKTLSGLFPSNRQHLGNDDFRDDKTEDYQNCSVPLNMTVAYNDTHMHGCWFRLSFCEFVCVKHFVFFCFSLDYLILALFAFVALDLVSSVRCQETG